ncbi:GntR family transcriptional regulator [Tamaricihabitans halophyticus]|uniref:GntR family transcriptional regulator n=1 Tax=Tamaricihabitans halophyticus TaxID=1262583 RepID=A0A4R2R025_9PSEU|nr:GntR family transcriptional regulator [Tamaricihabitans halophyticus]TCP55317.1 GntR family transcriptional regulator [Tamaricihabitans halophyticus]
MTSGARPAKRPPTAQEAVLAEIRRAILGGDMPPGTQIFQDELATRFGVSRVPVRDALRTLEGEDLVTYVPRRGYHVIQLDVDELLEIQQIREILETEVLRRITPAVCAEVADRMAVAMDEMVEHERQEDFASWVSAHRDFHFALFGAAEMPYLTRILGQLWDASDLYRAHYMHAGQARQRADDDHRGLLAAVRAGQPAELVELMRAHRETTVRSIRRSLIGHPAD